MQRFENRIWKELAELTKFNSDKKVMSRNVVIDKIKETIKNGISMKVTKRRFCTNKSQFFITKHANGNVK